MSQRPGKRNSSLSQGGKISKTTLIIAVVLAFFLGGYAGSLVTKHLGKGGAEQTQQASPEITAEIQKLEALTRKEPGNLSAWTSLGNLYFDTHQHEKSIYAYERSLSLNPRDPDVLTDLGVMYLSVHQAQKALDSFDKAISIDPKHQIAHLNKGFALMEMGRKSEARASWQKLLQLNPKAALKDGTPVSTLIRDMDKR